jgi:hypothetical protein
MKHIYSISAILFLALLSISLVSAGTQIIPSYGHSFEMNDFQVNPDLTISEIINLCVQESCILNEGEESNELSSYLHKWKTVTIMSHYDNKVALILKYDSITNAEGTETTDSLRLTTILPYEPNQACIDYSFEPSKGCEIISTHISPEDYNARESIDADLKYLKELNVIDLTNEEIEEMSTLAEIGKSIHKFKGDWVQVGVPCYPEDITDHHPNVQYSDEDEAKGWAESCPSWGNSQEEISTIILPEKAYGVQENVISPNQDKEEISSSSLIYWIIGVAIIVIIVLFLVFRKKN